METVVGPKGCENWEFGATLDLLNLVFRITSGEPPNIGQGYPHMYQESNRENLRIIKVDGKVVSHVGIFPAQVVVGEATLKVGGIGGVATHPDYRGRGYASLLLQDCLRKMERENFDLSILWTRIPDFYRRLGWENAGYENIYFLDKGNISFLPPLKEAKVQKGYQGYLKQLWQLHNKEPLRVVRTEKTMGILLARPGVETFIALQDKIPLAYIVLREGRVEDYAGQPELVAGLIREVFQQKDIERLSVLTPSSAGLPETLTDLGIPKQQGYAGMLRVINLGSLLRKLNLSYIEFQQKGKDEFILKRGGDTIEVDLKMLSKLIFGPERFSDFGKDLFPVAFYWGRLDHM